jgi:hypothetical protein
MKIKTFISQSSHKDFFDLVDTVIANSQENKAKDKEILLSELVKEKGMLEITYAQYKGKFDELHRLISEYQAQQTEIRKKIRLVQLDKKQKKSAGSGYFKTSIRLGGSFQILIYMLLNSFYFNHIWDSVSDVMEVVI